jgi:FlaA1/EpsC-like NDP-sugar epimerase
VVLTMKQQIASGGPVTVTHPEMTRYFMTIPEAVQLTLQAAQLGRGGEVLMFDMGEPVNIVDLARDLIRLSGLEVGDDIEIVYTGVRPGEKLYEELFLPEETYTKTAHEKIFVASSRSINDSATLAARIQELRAAAVAGERAQIRSTFGQLIPEYQPERSLNQLVEPAAAATRRTPPVTIARAARGEIVEMRPAGSTAIE